MTDYLLEITFDARDGALEEAIQSRLFLTRSTGSAMRGDVLEAYFDSDGEREEAADMLRGLRGVTLAKTERERVDWLELYQQSLEPMRIGERFVVAPDATLIDDAARLPIVVPQEQAFGTGSHETTSLCIELLEQLQPRKGLDVGAGSGILAIAMHRLGAEKVIAFDNDPDAYGALRDNRLRNRVPEERMPLFIGSVEALRGGAFDTITMNIIPEVILPLLPLVIERMSGALILSGILTAKRDEVDRAAAEHGLRLETERSKGEWWAGVYRRASIAT